MGKMRLHTKVFVFLNSLFQSIRFSYHRLKEQHRYGKYEFPYIEELKGEEVYVLANGPSLKKDLDSLLEKKKFIDSYKFVLNYFSTSNYYKELKPSFYCLADKGFFMNNAPEGHVNTINAINMNTSWSMKLYVPNNYYASAQRLIHNPCITIIPISTIQFEGFEKNRYKYYKQGKAVPSFVNVTLMIEYILLNLGCKNIRLYGVDHTFFEGMTVNDNNIPCFVDKHFDCEELRPLYKLGGGYHTTSSWLMDKYLTFREHEILRGYADYLGAQIINCTKSSLIDAYVRLSQIEKQIGSTI